MGLLVLGIILNKVGHLDLIKSPNLYWIIFGTIAVIVLLLYWRTKNAVWGGLIIGLIIGIVFSIVLIFSGSAFDWYILGKGAIIGTLLGFAAELLGKLSDFLKKK